jgi:hypothetical protein
MKQRVSNVGVVTIDKQGSIWVSTNKSKSQKMGGKMAVPDMGCLLQAIRWFVQTTYMIMMHGINKTGRLLSINYLSQIPCRKTFFISSLWIDELWDNPIERTIQMIACFITELKASSKSTLGCQ